MKFSYPLQKINKNSVIILSLIALTLVTAGVIISYFKKNNTSTSQTLTAKPAATFLNQHPTKKVKKTTNGVTKHHLIQKNSSLSLIFKKEHLSQSVLLDILKNNKAKKILSALQPGKTIALTTNHGHFLALNYPFSETQILTVTRQDNKIMAIIRDIPFTKALSYKSGTIRHTLNDAAKHAGLTTKMRAELANMFKGQLNLARDLHQGDHFFVLYNEYYLNGIKKHPGHILAAELTHNHKRYQVIRYQLPHQNPGYYTANGRAISPLFLKFPCHFKRISSHFSYHRMDPILHKTRPHLGVDLAAPRGTPLRAIGNGVVIYHGKDHGYGNAILIRYNHTYKSLYGHMEKFAKGIKNYHYVKRGQIVGYVGSTGWSTGPHVHFEIYKNNHPVDPLKMKIPHNPPIPYHDHLKYIVHANQVLSTLHLFEQTNKTHG